MTPTGRRDRSLPRPYSRADHRLDPSPLPRKRSLPEPEDLPRPPRRLRYTSPEPRLSDYRNILDRHSDSIRYASFSAAGDYAVTCGKDTDVFLWHANARGNEPLNSFERLPHDRMVFQAHISDSARQVITSCHDGSVRIWELGAFKPKVAEISRHRTFRSARACQITPDGSYAVATFYRGIRDFKKHLRGGACMSSFLSTVIFLGKYRDIIFEVEENGKADTCKMSDDGSLIAVGLSGVHPRPQMATGNNIVLLNERGRELARFSDCLHNEQSCTKWDLSDTGGHLALVSDDQQAIEVYEKGRWNERPIILSSADTSPFQSVRCADHGRLVIAVVAAPYSSKGIRVFNVVTRTVLFDLTDSLDTVPIAIEPRVRRVSTISCDYEEVRTICKPHGDLTSAHVFMCTSQYEITPSPRPLATSAAPPAPVRPSANRNPYCSAESWQNGRMRSMYPSPQLERGRIDTKIEAPNMRERGMRSRERARDKKQDLGILLERGRLERMSRSPTPRKYRSDGGRAHPEPVDPKMPPQGPIPMIPVSRKPGVGAGVNPSTTSGSAADSSKTDTMTAANLGSNTSGRESSDRKNVKEVARAIANELRGNLEDVRVVDKSNGTNLSSSALAAGNGPSKVNGPSLPEKFSADQNRALHTVSKKTIPSTESIPASISASHLMDLSSSKSPRKESEAVGCDARSPREESGAGGCDGKSPRKESKAGGCSEPVESCDAEVAVERTATQKSKQSVCGSSTSPASKIGTTVLEKLMSVKLPHDQGDLTRSEASRGAVGVRDAADKPVSSVPGVNIKLASSVTAVPLADNDPAQSCDQLQSPQRRQVVRENLAVQCSPEDMPSQCKGRGNEVGMDAKTRPQNPNAMPEQSCVEDSPGTLTFGGRRQLEVNSPLQPRLTDVKERNDNSSRKRDTSPVKTAQGKEDLNRPAPCSPVCDTLSPKMSLSKSSPIRLEVARSPVTNSSQMERNAQLSTPIPTAPVSSNIVEAEAVKQGTGTPLLVDLSVLEHIPLPMTQSQILNNTPRSIARVLPSLRPTAVPSNHGACQSGIDAVASGQNADVLATRTRAATRRISFIASNNRNLRTAARSPTHMEVSSPCSAPRGDHHDVDSSAEDNIPIAQLRRNNTMKRKKQACAKRRRPNLPIQANGSPVDTSEDHSTTSTPAHALARSPGHVNSPQAMKNVSTESIPDPAGDPSNRREGVGVQGKPDHEKSSMEEDVAEMFTSSVSAPTSPAVVRQCGEGAAASGPGGLAWDMARNVRSVEQHSAPLTSTSTPKSPTVGTEQQARNCSHNLLTDPQRAAPRVSETAGEQLTLVGTSLMSSSSLPPARAEMSRSKVRQRVDGDGALRVEQRTQNSVKDEKQSVEVMPPSPASPGVGSIREAPPSCLPERMNSAELPNDRTVVKTEEETLESASTGSEIALQAAEARARVAFEKTCDRVTPTGARCLTGTRAFQTMVQLLKSELGWKAEKREVAHVVYNKTGQSNVCTEDMFLQAFCELYYHIQMQRRRRWEKLFSDALPENEEALLVFHARDLLKEDTTGKDAGFRPEWTDEEMDDVFEAEGTDMLVNFEAFIRAAERIVVRRE